MPPSFFLSFPPSQSRWQPDRKRNRKGLKDLLLLSLSFKDKWPSDNFPTTRLAWRPLWSVVMRKHRNQKDNSLNQGQKKIGKPPLFLSLPPTPPPSIPHRACSAFAGSIWVHLSRAWGPLCPLGLQGLSMLQCGSLLLWKRGAWACLLACLGHLKAPIHPIPCFTRPLAHPRCPEAWLV